MCLSAKSDCVNTVPLKKIRHLPVYLIRITSLRFRWIPYLFLTSVLFVKIHSSPLYLMFDILVCFKYICIFAMYWHFSSPVCRDHCNPDWVLHIPRTRFRNLTADKETKNWFFCYWFRIRSFSYLVHASLQAEKYKRSLYKYCEL